MSIKIGIVGLPNVGKSTLFKALTEQEIEIANYPFATIDPNVGVVSVPDERLDRLAAFSQSQKVVPAVIEFVDIAGLVKGAAEGEGLGNKFLSNIKEVDVIAEVVRIFDDLEIIHVAGKADPIEDIEVLEYELILKDLEAVERRLVTAEKDVKAQKKGAGREVELLGVIKEALERGELARNVVEDIDDADKDMAVILLKELQLLSVKPFIYVCNVSEQQYDDWQPAASLLGKIGDASWVKIAAGMEAEMTVLSDEERQEYMQSANIKASGLAELIRLGYETLGLMTFFTTGEKETRGWTVKRDVTAPEAGAAIHSDFQEKFIRAEVIQWEELLNVGSYADARSKGLLRTEGKEYVVQDGDVMEFKI